GVAGEGEHVRYAEHADARLIEARDFDEGLEDCEAAGASAHDHCAFGIGEAAFAEGHDAVLAVFDVVDAPAVEELLHVFAAIASAAAVVHEQHGVATSGEELRLRMPGRSRG